jgi:ACS family tartrate transporter-like MFS transporter
MSAGSPNGAGEAIGSRALAKAAWRILPLAALGYGVSFVDRVNIGFAALQMNRDLHFSASVYGVGAGLFFLSYAAFEVPSNLVLARLGPRRWLSVIMVAWGLLSAAMMLVRTPGEFYVMRLLLGVAEAGFFPGVIYYLGLWFPPSHRGRAISRFYVAAPLSTVVMGGLAGSLLGLNGTLGLAGWQWLFLVEGAPALVLGAVLLAFLPDTPATASWLEPRERAWLQRRTNAGSAPPGVAANAGLARTLADPRVLAMGAANFVVLGGYYCFNLSAPLYLSGRAGLGPAATGYLVAAGGVIAAAAMLAFGWRSDRSGERFAHLAAPLALMAVAFAVLSLAPSPLIVMAAYLAAVGLNGAVGGVFWSAATDVLDSAQAAVGVAVINTIGQVGSFLLPVLWGIARDRTGGFEAGLSALPVVFLVATGIVLWLRRQVSHGDRRRVAFAAPPTGSDPVEEPRLP